MSSLSEWNDPREPHNPFNHDCRDSSCGNTEDCLSCALTKAEQDAADEQAQMKAEAELWERQCKEDAAARELDLQVRSILPGLKRRITGGDNRGCRYLDAGDERRFRFLGRQINWRALALHPNHEAAMPALTEIVALGRAAAAAKAGNRETAELMRRYNRLIEDHGDILTAPEFAGVFPAEQLDYLLAVFKGLITARVTLTHEQAAIAAEMHVDMINDFFMPEVSAALGLSSNIGGAIRLPHGQITIHPSDDRRAFTMEAEIKIDGHPFADVSW